MSIINNTTPHNWCRYVYCARLAEEDGSDSVAKLCDFMHFYNYAKNDGMLPISGAKETEELKAALGDCFYEFWKCSYFYAGQSICSRNKWYTSERNELVFIMWTSGEPCTAVTDLFKRRWPNLRFFFRSEDDLNHIYTTNDKDGECFRNRWRTACCCRDMERDESYYKIHKEYFEDLDKALNHIGRYMGSEIPKDADEVGSISSKLGNKHEWCEIKRVTLVDDNGNAIPEGENV